MLIKLIIKQRCRQRIRRDIAHETVVVQDGKVGIIDAGESGKALGAGLSRAGAENDAAAEHDIDPGKLT